VVVLDAAVRSWPPIEPTCLRWSFPIWTVEDGLDPAALKPERPPKRKEPPPPPEPKEPEWSVERLVGSFISAVPITLAELREQAAGVPGLSWRRVSDLLSIAERQGLVDRVQLPGRGGPQGYVLRTTEVAE